MKKILVSGENGYIGKSFYKTMSKYGENYNIDFISVRDNKWEEKDFGDYDVFLHLAGKAHVSRNKKLESEYYEINTDLTTRLATKAKKDGVKQFIFMSSIIVYGSVHEKINSHTKPIPDNFYGNSKLLAEKNIMTLADNRFLVTILRPPMIYGYKSKGNFEKLKKLALKSPFFFKIDNSRSVLYIENLNEFIKWIIDQKKEGIFFPSDINPVSTSEIYQAIRRSNGKRTIFLPIPKVFVKIMLLQTMFRKIFGDLYYENNDLNMYKINLDFDLEKAVKEIITIESRENKI